MEKDVVDMYYQIIGDRIALRRKQIQVTQEDLANTIGMTRVSISNIEAGRQRAPIHTLYTIAGALETNIHTPLPKDKSEVDEHAARTTTHRLAMYMGINPDEHKQALREIIDRMNQLKDPSSPHGLVESEKTNGTDTHYP